MRRETLLAAVERITGDLQTSGVASMFQTAVATVRTKDDKPRAWLSMEAFYVYSVETAAYGEAEREVLSILGLSDLRDPTFWQKLIVEPDLETLHRTAYDIRFALTFLPKIIGLLRRGYSATSRDTADAEIQVQTVLLDEDERSMSSPDRLIYVLQSVKELYAVIAELHGEKESSLSVVGLDSGSEKSVDFAGAGKFMAELRETLLSLWHGVIYHKQNLTLKNLSVVNEALPIIARIDSLEQEGALKPEDSSRLKNRVLTSVTKFVEAGATIPEMNQTAQLEPRLVMRPQPKLLTGPKAGVIVEEPTQDRSRTASGIRPSPEFDPRQLTSDQLAQIAAILGHGQATAAQQPRRSSRSKQTGSRKPANTRKPRSSGPS